MTELAEFSVNGEITSHFWASSYPFFESTLVISSSSKEHRSNNHKLKIYDADGRLANEAELMFPAFQVGLVELDQLLGSVKLESGFKSAHIVVTSPEGTIHRCRLQSKDAASIYSQPIVVKNTASSFSPITISQDRETLVGFINLSNREVPVKSRLICGNRSPETVCSIPAFGARVIGVESEFPGYVQVEEGRQLSAYLRVSARTDQGIGMHVFERVTIANQEGGLFSAIS